MPNPAVGTWGACTPKNFWNCHNFEILFLFVPTFELLSYILKGVVNYLW